MKYPADYVDGATGEWKRIHVGHALDRETLRADFEHSHAAASGSIEEVWLHYHPRVKWCGRYGWPCDNEGEWHSHWAAAAESADNAFTLVSRVREADKG